MCLGFVLIVAVVLSWAIFEGSKLIGIADWSCGVIFVGVVYILNLLLRVRVDGLALEFASLGDCLGRLQFSKRSAVLSFAVDGLVPILSDFCRFQQALTEVTHTFPFSYGQIIQYVLISDLSLHSLTTDAKCSLL